MSSDHDEIEDVLGVWLGPGDEPDDAHRTRWFTKDPEHDRMLRERFGALLERAGRGELDGWAATPRGALALLIVLDQLSRNIHRGSPRSFENDARALELARAAIARGDHLAVPVGTRVFFGMPLMHAEDPAAQEDSVRFFEALAAETGEGDREGGAVDYARRHRDIVVRFGRFPHRNTILGRTSTGDEVAFLTTKGSSF
jgi:uncharacterized protein (DUF924 family)